MIVEHYDDGSFHVVISDGRHFAGFQVEAFRRRGYYAVSKAVYVAAYWAGTPKARSDEHVY
jgi:hypothetical protein